MTDVVILAARRTAIGRFLGSLQELSAVDLAASLGETLFETVDRASVDLAVLGNVLAAGQGMNIARQLALRLKLPLETPAYTVNMMCASGLQSVRLAAQAIQAGEARCVLCGGTESMSRAPRLLASSRTGMALGDAPLVDSILQDGLIDPSSRQHMGQTVERLVERYGLAREALDQFALQSQQRYFAAEAAGDWQRERVPTGRLTTDEHPRSDTSLERLSRLKPAFQPGGQVTAGNASGINDGAALLIVAERRFAEERGYPILARMTGGTAVGCDPAMMGLGPVFAIRKLLQHTATSLDDYDTIEINEAFAAQVLACLQELELPVDRVNRQGGAIAIGHPIGASGARLAVHLVQQIASGRSRHGLAGLCVGGGMGIAASFAAP